MVVRGMYVASGAAVGVETGVGEGGEVAIAKGTGTGVGVGTRVGSIVGRVARAATLCCSSGVSPPHDSISPMAKSASTNRTSSILRHLPGVNSSRLRFFMASEEIGATVRVSARFVGLRPAPLRRRLTEPILVPTSIAVAPKILEFPRW